MMILMQMAPSICGVVDDNDGYLDGDSGAIVGVLIWTPMAMACPTRFSIV